MMFNWSKFLKFYFFQWKPLDTSSEIRTHRDKNQKIIISSDLQRNHIQVPIMIIREIDQKREVTILKIDFFQTHETNTFITTHK
jgi:hypothetical protein